MPEYVKVTGSKNLYVRNERSNINYSDGDDFELKLYKAIQNINDRSTFSTELLPLIVDWPSEYHLSRMRHCLLRPLGIRPGEKVLELGCGCGAITRYLGELGAAVTAVDGSLRRALIADERCRDLSNVKVVVDDLTRFEATETFDWVLLIGVLEYASVFSNSIDPTGDYLARATHFLNSDGQLIIAIENKLGLKYFNGCAEDHVGSPFIGIQNLYKPREPKTFGRFELEKLIRSAGHRYVKFFYPFPDYKLPRIILPREALHDPEFDPADLFLGIYARDYGRNAQYLFDEPMVWRQLFLNGLVEHLSNSFLVVSGNSDSFAGRKELAFVYNAQRSAEFALQTRIMRSPNRMRVIKERLCPDLPQKSHYLEGRRFEHLKQRDFEFVHGELAVRGAYDLRASNASTEEIVASLLPWFRALIDRSEGRKPDLRPMRVSELMLPGNFVDATPFNMVKDGDHLTAIDLEWQFDEKIPLGWVLARSILHTFSSTPGFEEEAFQIADVISAVATRSGLSVSRDEITEWFSYETKFQRIVQASPIWEAPNDAKSCRVVSPHQSLGQLRDQLKTLNEALIGRDTEIVKLSQAVAQLDQSLAQRDAETAQRDAEIASLNRTLTTMYQSTSWKITAWLRNSKRLFAALGKLRSLGRKA
jgi:SAM-dependent methyltransferase